MPKRLNSVSSSHSAQRSKSRRITRSGDIVHQLGSAPKALTTSATSQRQSRASTMATKATTTNEPTSDDVLGTHTSANPASNSNDASVSSNPPRTYTYYHAGPLFSLGDLSANVHLSRSIHTLSSSKYIPILPQDLEQRDTTPHSIRDSDIRALLSCDMALFTYDGSELDSGTVVEYLVAKMADIPAVILRTDFRGAGDQGSKGDPWNLMSSFWPRTRGVVVDGMLCYKLALAQALKEVGEEGKGKEGQRAAELLVEMTAIRVVEALDEVSRLPARMPQELKESVYTWIALMVGFRDGGDDGNVKHLLDLLKEKEGKGLL